MLFLARIFREDDSIPRFQLVTATTREEAQKLLDEDLARRLKEEEAVPYSGQIQDHIGQV